MVGHKSVNSTDLTLVKVRKGVEGEEEGGRGGGMGGEGEV